MKTLSGKQFAVLLEKKGWILARINGSYHIYIKSGTIFRISLPIHGNKPLKAGLQKHLMKIAEINENET